MTDESIFCKQDKCDVCRHDIVSAINEINYSDAALKSICDKLAYCHASCRKEIYCTQFVQASIIFGKLLDKRLTSDANKRRKCFTFERIKKINEFLYDNRYKFSKGKSKIDFIESRLNGWEEASYYFIDHNGKKGLFLINYLDKYDRFAYQLSFTDEVKGTVLFTICVNNPKRFDSSLDPVNLYTIISAEEINSILTKIEDEIINIKKNYATFNTENINNVQRLEGLSRKELDK